MFSLKPSQFKTVIYFRLIQMASKWNDQLDFMDELDKKKPKKDEIRKNRPSNSNNDYYDLEQDSKNLKLPTIGKNALPTAEKSSKSSSNINLVEISKKKAEVVSNKKTEKDQQDYEFQQSLGQNPSSVKLNSPPRNENKKVENVQKQVQEESYEEQFEKQENYEDDFEVHEEKKLSPVGYKPKEPSKAAPKTVNVPKPVQKQRKGDSVAKKTEISGKANSRHSIRSQSASRTVVSRAKNEEKKEQPNKYTTLAQKACLDYDRAALEDLNVDKLVRQNDKIRNMIKKFNDELNDLINKNIMQLKNKKEEKVVLADDLIKVLEEQKNNNETVYQTTSKDLQRLKGKQGELKQEEYQLSIQQKITETKAALNQYTKNITKLKQEVNNEGNKLSKIDKQKDNSSTQEINNLKNNFMLIKKEEEKNDQTLEKLYIKFEELTKKNSDVDSRFNNQIEDAKLKGFSVQINPQLTKKSEDTKKKLENSRLHKSKTEGLYKTKCEMIVHDCEQVKGQVKTVETQIQICMNNCQQAQNQIRKLVEKARRSSKLSQELLNTLESIISELQNGTPMSNREKQDHPSFSYPKGAKKYQSQKNVEKLIVQANIKEVKEPQIEKTQDDSNLKKPNLFKKKQKSQQKQEERVWIDDKNAESKRSDKNVGSPIPQLAKFQNKEQVQKKDDEKKKPFVIKRSKESGTQAPKEEPKVEKVQLKKQPEKSEEVPSIAPRMMKFRKNKQDQNLKEEENKAQQVIEKPISIPKIHERQSKPEQKLVQQQSQKPVFAPKRFQIKPKQRNNQDVGYIASVVEKKQESKAVEQFKPKGLIIEKEPINTYQAKTEQPITLNSEQEKPKFNLRLRDKQRQSNKQQAKIELPIQPTKQPQQKISITLNDKSKQNNNQFANPYAINTTNQPPKRQREGPLKKQKPTQNAQKQNFNIYDQAEDITNAKEIKIGYESPKENLSNPKQSEEPNLHDLLGIKKNKNVVDQDLLVDTKILGNKGGKVQKKKDTNFFGDLQL